MSRTRKHLWALMASVLVFALVLSASIFAFANETQMDGPAEAAVTESAYDYDAEDAEALAEVEAYAVTATATLVSPPSFMDYAVFDMLDLRGIEIQVGTDTFTYTNITPAMITWADGRDLNYRADFIADQDLDVVTRTLIITIEGQATTIPVPVRRYAFAEGTRFSIVATSHHPVAAVRDGELGTFISGGAGWLRSFPDTTSMPLGPDGKFPASINPRAEFAIVHNIGNQVGYGIQSILDGRVWRTDLAGNWNFWADHDNTPAAVDNQMLWRIIRLPNGYRALVYFNNEATTHAPRTLRPIAAAAAGTNMPGTPATAWDHIANPGEWNDANRWFIVNVEHDVPATLTGVGEIQMLDGFPNVGNTLGLGTLTFDVAGNPLRDTPMNIQWYRGTTATGPWTVIAGATGRNYALVDADEGNWVRVRVTPDGTYMLGTAMYSAAFGPVLPAFDFTISSGDVANVRLLEMGWLEITWRNRMYNSATSPLRDRESFIITIDGQPVGISDIRHFAGSAANQWGHTVTNLRLAGWENLYIGWRLNYANPGFQWLQHYDVAYDYHDLFEWVCAVETLGGVEQAPVGMWQYRLAGRNAERFPGEFQNVGGAFADFDIQIQFADTLTTQGGVAVDSTIVYDVLYVPYYQFIGPSDHGPIIRQSGRVARAISNVYNHNVILNEMLQGDQKNFSGTITDELVRRGFYTGISGQGENVWLLPEHRGRLQYLPTSIAGGYGAGLAQPVNAISAGGTGIASVNTIVHEVAHAIDLMGFLWLGHHPVYGDELRILNEDLIDLYMQIIEQGWFLGAQVGNVGFANLRLNRGEMFASLSEIWFYSRGQNNAAPTGRASLQAYLPQAFEIMSRIYYPQTLPPMRGWNPPNPSTFSNPAPFRFVPIRGAGDDFSLRNYTFGQGVANPGVFPPGTPASVIQMTPPYVGQYFSILHFMNSDIVSPGTWTTNPDGTFPPHGNQVNNWWSYDHHSVNHGFDTLSWVVTPVVIDGNTYFHFSAKTIHGQSPGQGSGGAGFSTLFGDGQYPLGTWGLHNHPYAPDNTNDPRRGRALGMIPEENVIGGPVRTVIRDLEDPNQLWSLVSFQGRYSQLVNKASGHVLTVEDNMPPGNGTLLVLGEYNIMPEFSAIWRVMQLRPAPIGPLATRHFSHAVVPERWDIKMQEVWIDADCDRTVWIRWQEPVNDAVAGNVENYTIVLGTESIALVQEGSESVGRITRLMLAEPAPQAMLEGLGSRIRFTGEMSGTVSGLPVNNQLFYNFRRDANPRPIAIDPAVITLNPGDSQLLQLVIPGVAAVFNEDWTIIGGVEGTVMGDGTISNRLVISPNQPEGTLIVRATFGTLYAEAIVNVVLPPVFTLQVFNNNNDNVPSIAGTIRMWTQLNGVNAIVPYAELDVTATFP
ncbi:MAG: hypothetical protein FWC93_04290, partial [Defluviitaleaceae bacterium]|nr:hypothetical protein [Defluviitaleaceae bacterium]